MDFKPFKIGKYLLLEKIASGGMAEVYRAKSTGAGGFEKQLAIKRILPNYSANDEFRRMFEYEARLSSQLTHANIVQIYDFSKSSETYLLAMEYVNGKNLRQFINKAKKVNYQFSIECSVFVINEVCKGLDYAHWKKDDLTGKPLNIIHRDMSPQNIMVTYEGAVKIVDFGIAKAKDRVDETRSGVIKGKFGYMSPEQANGEVVDHRSDIFSTAIILYEMLTHKRLFVTDNDLATLKMIQECSIAMPSRVNPKISQELEKIVMKGLTKDKTSRYQTASAFHRLLQGYINKYYPHLTQKDVSDGMQKVFAQEINEEKKRFEEVYRQSIPFSQGETEVEKDELDEIESALDGSFTKSEHELNTVVTLNEEEEVKDVVKAIEDLKESVEQSKSSIARDPLSFSKSEAEISKEATRADGSFWDEESRSKSFSKSHSKSKSKVESAATPTVPATKHLKDITDPGESMPVLTEANIQSANQKRIPDISLKDIVAPGTPTKKKNSEPSLTPSRSFTKEPEVKVELTSLNQRLNRKKTHEKEEYIYVEKAKGSRVSMLAFALTLITVSYLYSVWYQGNVPVVVKQFEERNEASQVGEKLQGIKEIPKNRVDTPSFEGCILQVTTDPPSASWKINGQDKGAITPILLPCNQKVVFTVLKPGYETVEKEIVLAKETKPFNFNLKASSEGELELKINFNAIVYIDGEKAGEFEAGAFHKIRMSSDRKHRLRFVNAIYHIDTTAEVVVKKGMGSRQEFKIDELPKYR